jgi:putative oxidoreductase
MNKIVDLVRPFADAIGRALIAVLYLLSGWGKISAYADTQAYMQHAGVPAALLPLVILLELGGGIAVVIGFCTRPAALLMAGFSITVAFLFHNAADQVDRLMFLKDLGLAGGFLFLVANGAGRLSVDAWLSDRANTHADEAFLSAMGRAEK